MHQLEQVDMAVSQLRTGEVAVAEELAQMQARSQAQSAIGRLLSDELEASEQLFGQRSAASYAAIGTHSAAGPAGGDPERFSGSSCTYASAAAAFASQPLGGAPMMTAREVLDLPRDIASMAASVLGPEPPEVGLGWRSAEG